MRRQGSFGIAVRAAGQWLRMQRAPGGRGRFGYGSRGFHRDCLRWDMAILRRRIRRGLARIAAA